MTKRTQPKDKEASSGFGRHLTIDGYGGIQHTLDCERTIERLLDNLPRALGMTIIHGPNLKRVDANGIKDPGGVSGFVMIAESHISIHTFPRRGFVSADVYTCRNELDTEHVVNLFLDTFGLTDVETNFLIRGTQYPMNDLYD